MKIVSKFFLKAKTLPSLQQTHMKRKLYSLRPKKKVATRSFVGSVLCLCHYSRSLSSSSIFPLLPANRYPQAKHNKHTDHEEPIMKYSYLDLTLFCGISTMILAVIINTRQRKWTETYFHYFDSSP